MARQTVRQSIIMSKSKLILADDITLPIEGYRPEGVQVYTPDDIPGDALKKTTGQFKAIKSDDPEVAAYIEGYFTTPDVDEGNDITLPTAFIGTIDDYMKKNPVVLLNHDMVGLPVGQTDYYRIDEKGVWVKIAIEGLTDRGKAIAKLATSKRRYLRGFSYQYKILDWEPGQNGAPNILKKLRLYEITIASVGMNLNALTDATNEEKLLIKKLFPGWDEGTDAPGKGIYIMPQPIEQEHLDNLKKEMQEELKKKVDVTVGELKKEVGELTKTTNNITEWQTAAKRTEAEFEQKLDKFTKDMTDANEKVIKQFEELERKAKASIAGAFMTPEDIRSDFKTLIKTPTYAVENIVGDSLKVGQIERLKKMHDGSLARFSVAMALGDIHPGTKYLDWIKGQNHYEELNRLFQKVMYTTATGYGAEFIDEVLSSELKEKIDIQLRVRSLFERHPMASDPDKVPAEGADFDAIGVTEQTANISAFPVNLQTPGTREVEFTAGTIRGAVQVSRKMLKWSVIDLAGYINRKLSRSIFRSSDKMIINGQKSGLIDASVVDPDARLYLDGIRKLCPSAGKFDLGTFSESTLNQLDVYMSDYAVPDDCVYLASMRTILKHFKMLDNVRTLDKIGDKATIRKGTILDYEGKNIIPSQFVYNNLNNAGVYDGVTTDRSILILINTRRWAIGDPSDFEVAQAYYPGYRTNQIFIYDSFAFEPWDDLSTETPVAIGYNIS